MRIGGRAPGQHNVLPWVFAALVSALVLAACAIVPITGRSQLMLVSDAQMSTLADRHYAEFLKTAREWDAILSPSDISSDAQAAERVTRIGQQIVAAAGLEGRWAWEFTTIRSRRVNAFALPNGKVVVFTGILPVTQSDAGLAAVVGHEVAHVMARHAAERMSQTLLVNLGLSAANAALARTDPKYRPWISAALQLGALHGVLYPYSRTHELEADRIGLLLMAKAGYDPAEAIRFWERMEARGGGGPWEYLPTHPSDATRRAQIAQWLSDAKVWYAERAQPLPRDVARPLPPPPGEQRLATEPVAFRPAFPVGATFRVVPFGHTRTFEYRIDRFTPCRAGECYAVREEAGRVGVYSQDFALVEVREPDGRLAIRYAPPLEFYRWPLRVGETWSQEYRAETVAGAVPGAATLTGQVTGYETVTAAAGTFVTYKVQVWVNGRPYREHWFAPAAGMPVRTILYDEHGESVTAEVVELGSTLTGSAQLPQKPVSVESSSIAAAPARDADVTRPRPKDGGDMVFIAAGTFRMGSSGPSEEKPVHTVTVTPFWMDRFEVTNAQFHRFRRAADYHPEGDWRPPTGEDDYPATQVTWNDAAGYCYWAGERLPTEAEWEYAAGRTDGRRYPWGNRWEAGRAHVWGLYSRQRPIPVGASPGDVSPLGVHDLAGNVAEWVNSLFRPYPYVASDGREDDRDPGLRVIRGGSATSAAGVTLTARRGVAPLYHDAELGFRCVRDP